MRRLSLIVGICILCSCDKSRMNSQMREDAAKERINMQACIKQESIILNEIFDTTVVFPIPTDENYLIGTINKLIVSDSIFAMLDSDISHSAFLLNKYTGWKYCINRQGKGPTEYINPCDIMFHPTLDMIGVFCNYNRKIIYYRLDGEFSHEYKIPMFANAIHPVSENVVAYTDYVLNESLAKSGLYPNLIMCDSLQNVISCKDYFVKNINPKVVWSSRCSFSCWDDTLAIKPDHSNTVYHCTADSIYAAYNIDFGFPNAYQQYWEKATEKKLKVEDFDRYCRQIGVCETIWYLESQDYIYFAYRGDEINHVIHSKKTKETRQFKKLVDTKGNRVPFYPKAIFQDKLYVVIYPHNLKKNKYTRVLLDEYIVKDTDNPVVVELTLKNF